MSTERIARSVIEFAAEDAKLRAAYANIKKENKATGDSFKALGRDAQSSFASTDASLARLNAESTKTRGIVEGIGSSAVKMAGVLGVAFSASAVINFAKSLAYAAGEIDDTAKKLGVSTDAVQRWKHAAELGGVTIDTVGTAVSKMNQLLGQGNKGTVNALKLAGLEFNQIRRMKPEDAFDTITAAIEKIEDPMVRAQVAVGVFGKSGQDLLPAIVEGFAKTGEATAKMSELTIARLTAAQDAWENLGRKGKAVAADMLGSGFAAIDRASSSWADTLKMMQAALPGGGHQLFEQIRLDAAERHAAAIKSLQGKAPTAASVFGSGGGPAAAGFDVNAYLKDQESVLTRAAAATKKHDEAMRQLVQTYTGAAAIQKAKDAVEAVTIATQQGIPISKMSADQQKAINTLVGDAIDVYRRQGKEAPESMRLVWLATLQAADGVKVLSLNLKDLGQSVPLDRLRSTAELLALVGKFGKDAVVGIDDLLNKLPGKSDIVNTWLDEIEAKEKAAALAAQELRGALRDVSGVFMEIAGNSESAWASVLRDLSRVIDAIDRAAQATQNYANATTTMGRLSAVAQGVGAVWQATGAQGRGAATMGGMASGAQAGMMFGPYGAIAGAVIGGVVGWLRSGNNGRQMVEQFAQSQGGFDALSQRLHGVEGGAAAWRELTQRVGSGDTAHAGAAIDAVIALLEKQAQAERDVAQAAEESAQRQVAALEQVQSELDDLTQQRDSLVQSIADEAPEEVMGVIETETRARIAQIEAQMAAKQQEIDAATEAARAANADVMAGAEQVNAHIRGLFSEPIRIPIRFEVEGGNVSHAALGGRVTQHGVQYLAAGGPAFAPMGTDTVPAMLTPGEFVLNRIATSLIGAENLGALNAGRMPASMAGGRETVQHVTVNLGGRTILKHVARGLPRELVLAGI
jgi:hypothetical protein